MNYPERIKEWYNLYGDGAGFLLETAQDLTAFLQPYMDLMNFEVRAIYGLDYEQHMQTLREAGRPGLACGSRPTSSLHTFQKGRSRVEKPVPDC